MKSVLILFSPSVTAVLVRTNVVQPHLFFSSTSLSLKEYGFPKEKIK